MTDATMRYAGDSWGRPNCIEQFGLLLFYGKRLIYVLC